MNEEHSRPRRLYNVPGKVDLQEALELACPEEPVLSNVIAKVKTTGEDIIKSLREYIVVEEITV